MSQPETIRAFGPIAKRTTEKLCQFAMIGGERRCVSFERDILWLQESETQILFMHGGQIVREGSSFNDWYGYLTSFEHCGPEAIAKQFGITRKSSLELTLHTKVFQSPCLETPDLAGRNKDNRAKNYRLEFMKIPDEWRRELFGKDDEPHYPALERVELGHGFTWSSKLSVKDNAVMSDAFKLRWAVRA